MIATALSLNGRPRPTSHYEERRPLHMRDRQPQSRTTHGKDSEHDRFGCTGLARVDRIRASSTSRWSCPTAVPSPESSRRCRIRRRSTISGSRSAGHGRTSPAPLLSPSPGPGAGSEESCEAAWRPGSTIEREQYDAVQPERYRHAQDAGARAHALRIVHLLRPERRTSTTRNDVSFQYRRALSSNWLIGSYNDFLRSDEQQLDLRAAFGGLVARRFTRTNRGELTISGGVVFTSERYAGSSAADRQKNTEGLLAVRVSIFRFDSTNLYASRSCSPV